MRMYDLILKKRNGGTLDNDQLRFFVEGFVNGSIPDYQAAALLMAIYFQGMDEAETAAFTMALAHSGAMVDLSTISGRVVDKHSTGGVGDKTSLVVGPIAAACGTPVAKMSGRGLGHTGGTVDKLESIPGLKMDVTQENFLRQVQEIGIAIIGQSENIAPGDKKIYALRDVTATVDNISLIASSVMSKKLATGSDAILLDVKTGSGAFMKSLDDSVRLAEAMVSIGVRNDRETVALVTNMDAPLGNAIGNTLEIIEVVETLKGNGPKDLHNICIELAAHMLNLAQKGNIEQCRKLAEKAITDGSAFAKFKAMTKSQGGDVSVLDDVTKFTKASAEDVFISREDGFITSMDAEAWGIASVALGAGRAKKEDIVDHSAGIILCKKPGDAIKKGDVIAKLYASNIGQIEEATSILSSAVVYGNNPPAPVKPVLAKIGGNS